jgi:transposase
MDQITRIGMDTSKHVFQLHGVNGAEEPVLRKKLRRQDMVAFFSKLPPTVVALEAGGGSHHWARLLQSLGHQVKLIAPQLAKPYVKRGKNDAADAEALCEAMSRPTMRFVPVKTTEQQAALMLVGRRDRLIRQRTQLVNAIRGYAAEFGLVAAKGICRVEPLLERIRTDETLSALAQELFEMQATQYAQLQAQLEAVEDRLMAWHRAHEGSRRLARIPGVGPIGASMRVMKTPTPEAFRSAPSTRSRRRYRSPCLEMCPSRTLPPVPLWRGTSPIQAAKCRPERKEPGSVIVAASALAVIRPMPGIVSRRWLSSFVRCQARISCSTWPMRPWTSSI